jgi:hypothetical protein
LQIGRGRHCDPPPDQRLNINQFDAQDGDRISAHVAILGGLPLPVPRQQFSQAIDGVSRHAIDHVGELRFRIGAVELWRIVRSAQQGQRQPIPIAVHSLSPPTPGAETAPYYRIGWGKCGRGHGRQLAAQGQSGLSRRHRQGDDMKYIVGLDFSLQETAIPIIDENAMRRHNHSELDELTC